MHKVKIILVILILLLIVGCTKKSVVGSWVTEDGNDIYIFNTDGTGKHNDISFTYTVDGNNLEIYFPKTTAPFQTSFEFKKDNLIIKNSIEEEIVYIKKEE